MSERPFGFGQGSGEGPNDPFGGLFGANSGDLSAALHRFADLLAWQGGPVNWDLAKETAARTAGDDAGTSPRDGDEVAEALRLADLWLDPTTTMPSGITATEAWSRRRWLEATLPVWRELVDPVAGRVVDAMGEAMGGALGSTLGGLGSRAEGDRLPAELSGLAGPLLGMLRQVGGAMFGTQVGQALGSLAGEVVSSTDVGLPLGPAGRGALLPANGTAFGAGLGVPADEVRLFLALREAAHHRLFGHVAWLRGHLLDAVEAFARGITIDMDALESAVREVDPADPQSLQRALSGGLFEPRNTAEQQAALARLETALALVEGWVDEVVATAADGHLPAAGALRETVRRRRAVGGPAEQTFASLVGLELRPRRLREAATLWHELTVVRGTDGRDALWSHPDLLPDAEDLDDPAGFARRAPDALDLSGLPPASDEEPPRPPSPSG